MLKTTETRKLSSEYSQIQIFNSPQFGEIRTAKTENNEPLFCLLDVCKCLDLSAKGVNQRLNDEVISNYPIIDNLGREQQALFVNEDGLYDVILDSRKPIAKSFRKWITSEILPSIRKTGGYIATTEQDTPELIMARALQVAQQTIENHKQRLQIVEAEKEHYKEEVKALAPKAEYTDEVLQSSSTYTFTQIAKELNFRSAQSLVFKLKEQRIIFKQSGQYQLTCRYAGKGYATTRTARYFQKDGTPCTSTSMVWTELGRMFLQSQFSRNKQQL